MLLPSTAFCSGMLIARDLMLFLAIWMLNFWCLEGASVPQSPCPDVFQYEQSNEWFGIITVPSPYPVLVLDIEIFVYYTIKPPKGVSLKLKQIDDRAWYKLADGDKSPILYRVGTGEESPVPSIANITLNGKVICSRSIPGAFRLIIGTQSIQYNSKCKSGSLQCPNNVAFVQPSKENIESTYENLSQSTASPCPNIFKYKSDGYGNWNGLILIPNPYPVIAINLVVELYMADNAKWYGRGNLSLVNDLNSEWKRIMTCEKYNVPYKLVFPFSSPIPTIKKIIVNGQDVCSGSRPTSYEVVSKKYEHNFYSLECKSSSLDCPGNTVPLKDRPSRCKTETTTITEPPKWKPGLTNDNEPSTSSSCPNTFKYKIDDSGNWYGIIMVPNPYPITAINLVVELYVAENVNWDNQEAAGVSLLNSLTTEWKKMLTCEQYDIPYRLIFPFKSPLPSVKRVIVNGDVICEGNKPSSYKVTSTKYEHNLFNKKCTTSSLSCPDNIVAIEDRPSKCKTATIRTTTTTPTITRRPTQKPESSWNPAPTTRNVCGQPVEILQPLILQGNDVIHGQWPWQAAIYLNSRGFSCGGSLVSKRSIITAGHCMIFRGETRDPKDITVHLGRHDLRLNVSEEKGSLELKVESIFVHESYKSTPLNGDIAILILASVVQTSSFVRPVCLWGREDTTINPLVDKKGLVAGWGYDEVKGYAEELKVVSLPVVDKWLCNIEFPDHTSNTTFCAGERNGLGVCRGDSGSGLMFPQQMEGGSKIWKLRGIVSFSKKKGIDPESCDSESYFVFTDVAFYLDWILDIIH